MMEWLYSWVCFFFHRGDWRQLYPIYEEYDEYWCLRCRERRFVVKGRHDI